MNVRCVSVGVGCLVLLGAVVSAEVVTTYAPESPVEAFEGVAVQHFTVPYRSRCTRLEFYCVVTNPAAVAGHTVHVQVYDSAKELRGSGSTKVGDLNEGRGWLPVDGLDLERGCYYTQLFTNSDAVRPLLRAHMVRDGGYGGGHAATGWKGGVPLGKGEDFQVRLTLGRMAPPVDELGDDDTFLVKNGKPNYAVVLSREAQPAHWTAADELVDHLERISGARLPVLLEDEWDGEAAVAIGFNARMPESLQRSRFDELAKQELLIEPEDGVLLLAGGSPLGALHATYEFLHGLGVRWYTPTYTKCPELRDIPSPSEGYRYAPPIVTRKLNAGNGYDRAWLARNRVSMITLWAPLGAEYGTTVAEGPDMHTFQRLVKGNVLKAHPDWMALVDGKREEPVGHTWGMCLSNEEARRYVIDRTVDYARKNPHISTVWVGQNDGSQPCECAECQAFCDAHGGVPSAWVVRLVNELSDALDKELPGRLVKTLAYGWSLTPPEGMELRDNAVVMFCAGGSFFHPIATDPKRAALREAMAGWGAIAKHRDVYLYFPHHDYWFPAPCTLAGGDNIRWCHDAGADNAYAAVSGWSNWFGSESVHLRAWVYARMLWDPTLEIQPLVDEFIADYYGPAAEVVAEAFRIVHDDIFDDTGALRVCNDSAVAPEFVDPVKMRAINRLFEDAYGQLPEGDYRERLEFAWLPYLWADFWLGFSGFGRYDRDARTWSVPLEDGALRNAYGARFKRLAIKHGVEALGELKKLEPHSLGLDKAGVPWPAHLVTGGTSEAVVVPGVGGHIVDYRDARTGFAPLKEAWRGLALQYPNFTTTEEKINGTPVGEYAVVAASPESVDLRADLKNCVVGKSVRFEGDTLHSDVSVEATAAGPLHCTSCVMFDLQDSVFGPHPTLYTERTDGTWTARDLGAETDFWWVEGNLDIANATGRMVLARQDRPEGVMFTFEPDQIGNLYHWYDRYWVGPEDQCKMLRFFLNSPTVEAQAGDAVRVNWSVRILEDARSVVKGE